MTTEDSAMVDALADAVAGTVMLVMGGAHTGFFGVVKQKITTAIGVTVDSGPAKPLINEVTWHFRTLSTPAATKIGMIDRSWEEESSPRPATGCYQLHCPSSTHCRRISAPK